MTNNDFFLKEFLKNKKEIIITVVTNDYCDLTRNWYESLKKINCHHLALVIALDFKCYDTMVKHKIPVIKSIFTVTDNDTIQKWRNNEKNTKIGDALYISKTYNVNIFYSEVDIVFFKNPLDKIKQEISNGYDICVLSDRRFDSFYINRDRVHDTHIDKNDGTVKKYEKSYHITHGVEVFAFNYIPKTQKNLDFLSNIDEDSEYFKKFEKSGSDGTLQTILINAIKDFDMKVKVLNVFEFPNGMVWNVPYLKNKIKDSCYLLHYNGIDGETPKESSNLKIEKMKEDGNWYLD